MKPVEEESNWGYFDTLDGTHLKEGEAVRLRFPDGSEQDAIIEIQRTSYTGTDMGSPVEIPTHRAYVILAYRGTSVRLYLLNSGVLLERKG